MKCKAVVISGLRRSGTTALWQCFRNIAQIGAYDEPFHPRLATGERDNPKQTWKELATLLTGGLAPVAISPRSELERMPSQNEIDYFHDLNRASERTVIDTVRAWNRIPGLYDDQNQTLTVNIIRDPRGWVTGHLLPSGKGTWRKKIANQYRRATFFTRRHFYNNYHYETIINEALRREHPIWNAVLLSNAELQNAPAFIKLLAFWWGVNLASYESLAESGAPFILMTLTEFSVHPDQQLQRILDAAEWRDIVIDSSHVTPTRASHGAHNEAWIDAARALGIPEHILSAEMVSQATLTNAFQQALSDGRSGL